MDVWRVLFRGQPLQVSVFRQADEQQPLRVEVFKKTGEGQAGPVDVQRPQRHVLIVGTSPQNFQVELPNDLAQFHAVVAF